MQHKDKPQKSKVRTLCTIDTSDIDLQDVKSKNYNNHNLNTSAYQNQNKNKNNKNKFIQSPIRTKGKIHDNQNVNMNSFVNNNNEKFENTNYHSIVQNNGNISRKMTHTKSIGKYFVSNNANGHKKQRHTTQASHSKSKSIMNKTISKSKSRIKTEYSTANSNQQIFKSILTKSSKIIKNKFSNPFQQTIKYNVQTYQIIQELSSQIKKQKRFLAKKADKLYIMKKTKDNQLKNLYENQWNVKQSLGNNIKWKNLEKLVKVYVQKNYCYAIYQQISECLSWNNPSHMQVIDKILNNQATAAKGINQLSSKGFVHSHISLETISIKIQQFKTTIRIEGNVKLTNLCHAFHINDKNNLLQLPQTIYTAPEIINLKLFQKKDKFDRQLIQYISYYDQGWYLDVWALGITILQLIAGQAISIEKVDKDKKQFDVSLSIESQQSLQSKQQVKLKMLDLDIQKQKPITLSDILQAQKSLLMQTQEIIQKISFDKKLQSLLIRMLSVNPLSRPSPKQIIKDL